jgi:hypothetical protein
MGNIPLVYVAILSSEQLTTAVGRRQCHGAFENINIMSVRGDMDNAIRLLSTDNLHCALSLHFLFAQ